MAYLSNDFLLHTPAARRLFHEFAETAPIYDYHCHLPASEIAGDITYENLSKLWLAADHYKWRAMRANGVDERFITGNASDREKFDAWAATMPKLIRNPLYDWAHLELRRYFGVTDLLSPETAESIYNTCNEKLKESSFSVRNLLLRMNVKVVGTTDDPLDDLASHRKLSGAIPDLKVVPTFRPDLAIALEDVAAWNRYIDRLGAAAGIQISSLGDLFAAIDNRHSFFHENGCRAADHGFERLDTIPSTADLKRMFQSARSGAVLSPAECVAFRSGAMVELCRMNHYRGWVQLFHFGVLRNACTRVFKALGPNTGVDIIGDAPVAKPIAALLDALDCDNRLTKTVLINDNSSENDLMACLAQAFQDGTVAGKIQFGPAWWFLDQKDGMRRQMESLSGLGLLSRFIGMTTDSRSFVSFPRHEYFRRILCGMLGSEMDQGDLPDDFGLVGPMVNAICQGNAREYFGF